MLNSPGRMDGKVCFISGGALGLGAATATTLVAHGARVVIGDLPHQAQKAEALIRRTGTDRLAFVELDVTQEGSWAKAIKFTLDRHGRLDVMVNNAGGSSQLARIDKEPLSEHEKWNKVNVTGVWHGIRAAIPPLRAAGGGSIINLSSMNGLQGVSGMASYTSQKYAVVGLTKSAALELGCFNIRVNSVHPGLIETEGFQLLTPEHLKRLDEEASLLPLRRVGRPEDIASAVLFFASEESSYCTGSQLLVDGGSTGGRHGFRDEE